MPAATRELRVAFYTLEPAPPYDDQRQFPVGAYPLAQVVAAIREMDPASEEYRIREHFWGGETLCLFHEDGPTPLLGAYYRDHLSRALTEYKGEVAEIELRDGEALVDASFAVFFPEDVVGLVRTSSASPSFARIGRWLSCIGTYACGLVALPDPSTIEQLDEHSTTLTQFRVRARRDRTSVIEQYNPRVAATLRAAADVNIHSDEIGAEWRNTRRKDQVMWSRLMRQEIGELLAVLPEFEEAKVRVSGRRQPIDLQRSYVQHTVAVPLIDSKLVGPEEAAGAIIEAYESERVSIASAVDAIRRQPDEWTNGSPGRPMGGPPPN